MSSAQAKMLIELNVPTLTVRDVVTTALPTIGDDAHRASVSGHVAQLEADEADYINAGRRGELHLVRPWAAADSPAAKQVGWLYSNKLRSRRSPARRFYDDMILSSISMACPLCSQREVRTLDHYLPSSAHPQLAVTPANLVPCCSDCNRAKLDIVATTAEELPLHPYFDRLPQGQWLHAEVIEASPLGVTFFADPPSNWPATLRSRAVRHFSLFQLAWLYGVYASRTLAFLARQLARVFDQAGSGAVRDVLLENSDVARALPFNVWEPVLLDALAASPWYCEGGFVT